MWIALRVAGSDRYLRHYDESSECETARQHKVAKVACYRLELTRELTKKKTEVDREGFVTYLTTFPKDGMFASSPDTQMFSVFEPPV